MNKMSELNSSVEFWIVGVIISLVSLFGFIGNITCILMFQYKRLNINKTFASLLSWPAIIDSFFLVSICMCFCWASIVFQQILFIIYGQFKQFIYITCSFYNYTVCTITVLFVHFPINMGRSPNLENCDILVCILKNYLMV
jgi:hypothetical protein